MSNTHLSLLENYSAVKYCKHIYDVFIYIYIYHPYSTWNLDLLVENPRKPHQEQYRMVPEISAFPSSYFYQGARLEQGGGDTNCAVPTYHCHWQVDCWMVRRFEVEGVVSWYLHFSSWTWNRWGLTQIWGQRTCFFWRIGGVSCLCFFFFPGTKKGLGGVFFSFCYCVELCCHFWNGQ